MWRAAQLSDYCVSGDIDGWNITVLFDTGSEISLIYGEHPVLKGKKICTAGFKLMTINPQPDNRRNSTLYLESFHTKRTFTVVTNIFTSVVLGVDFIQGNHKNFWDVNRTHLSLENIQLLLLDVSRRKCGHWGGGNSCGLRGASTTSAAPCGGSE